MRNVAPPRAQTEMGEQGQVAGPVFCPATRPFERAEHLHTMEFSRVGPAQSKSGAACCRASSRPTRASTVSYRARHHLEEVCGVFRVRDRDDPGVADRGPASPAGAVGKNHRLRGRARLTARRTTACTKTEFRLRAYASGVDSDSPLADRAARETLLARGVPHRKDLRRIAPSHRGPGSVLAASRQSCSRQAARANGLHPSGAVAGRLCHGAVAIADSDSMGHRTVLRIT